jgi:hypothetical protein
MKINWKICSALLVFGLVSLGICNRKTGLKISARIKSVDKYGIPAGFLITAKNDANQPLSIYRPSETQYCFWEYEIQYTTGKFKTFYQAGDISWEEGVPVKIDVHNAFLDSIETTESDFYNKEVRGEGCLPFLGAEKIRLIYRFKGARLPSDNIESMRPVLIEKNQPLKYKTVSGIFKTNWIEVEPIDTNLIQAERSKLLSRKDKQANLEVMLLPKLSCPEESTKEE